MCLKGLDSLPILNTFKMEGFKHWQAEVENEQRREERRMKSRGGERRREEGGARTGGE